MSDATGLMRLFIKRYEGGKNIIQGVEDTDIIISGSYSNDGAFGVIELKRVELFTPSLRNKRFAIIAHRGGGRTSDKLPVSENSCEMIKFSERLGANGIEIDVQITKDGVPVLYHDGDINIRLTQKGPIMGSLNQYTFQQLRSMVKLYHGEKIPSLREALDTVLYKTNIKFV
jgi:glycerophosphoryl diester phosphodiesterase